MINLSIKMEQIGEYNVTQNVTEIKQGILGWPHPCSKLSAK